MSRIKKMGIAAIIGGVSNFAVIYLLISVGVTDLLQQIVVIGLIGVTALAVYSARRWY
jgi:hypothetical protein